MTPLTEETARHRRPERERGLLKTIGLGLSIGLFALVMLIGAAAVAVPAVTGSTPMTILTGSMEPRYPVGTLIVVRPTPADEIRIGDVITYQLRSGEPEVVTHRVVGIGFAGGETVFTTQGDANALPDAMTVREVQVRGTVWYSIPLLGWVNLAVSGEARPWVVGSLVVLFFGYAGFAFARGIAELNRRRARRTRVP